MRLIAKAAKRLQDVYPDVHFHISSGNSVFVMEQLDKGLVDFGIAYGTPDLSKYHSLRIPQKNIWGVLMRKDSPLVKKAEIQPEDLYDLPLILSQQEIPGGELSKWLGRDVSSLNIAALVRVLRTAAAPFRPDDINDELDAYHENRQYSISDDIDLLAGNQVQDR